MKNEILSIIASLLVLCAGCGKEFLDIKRQSNQVVPTNVSDYMALLNETSVMVLNTPGMLPIVGGEEFTLSDAFFNAMTGANTVERKAYIWSEDVFEGEESRDWNLAFQRIMYANLARNVKYVKINSVDEQPLHANATGMALFHHAWNYYRLLTEFGEPYRESTWNKQCPIPYRDDYDIEYKGELLTYSTFYQKIIASLQEAAELLPDVQISKSMPNKAATWTLLARISLQMLDFENAFYYSDLAVRTSPELLDYNTLDLGMEYPFVYDYGKSNPEVLFYQTSLSVLSAGRTRMDLSPDLWNLYTENDLRREAFFSIRDGRRVYTGSYQGGTSMFVGLASSEAYLIRAECLARKGRATEALADMNYLLKHRVKKESFVPVVHVGAPEGLVDLVLQERRRELCFRGLRWEDLRRLNAEGKYTTDLHRLVNGQDYHCHWDSNNWYWQLPEKI